MAEVVAFAGRQKYIPQDVANTSGGLAHDLRNVMASLALCAEVMAQPGVLTAGNEYLAGEVRSVADAAIGLLRHVGQLREGRTGFPSRWTMTGGTGRSRVSGRVAHVLKNMESMLRRAAGAGVQLDMECAPCWGRLAMTAEDLARVLMNLVKNAGEAMPQGGRIRVTAQMAGGQSFASSGQPLQAASAVTISVQDDGPGIPGELAERIFESGFSTKERNEAERGLGLAVARDLVEMAGGALVLTPSVRGARFEIEVPLTNVMQSWAPQTRFDAEGGRA